MCSLRLNNRNGIFEDTQVQVVFDQDISFKQHLNKSETAFKPCPGNRSLESYEIEFGIVCIKCNGYHIVKSYGT